MRLPRNRFALTTAGVVIAVPLGMLDEPKTLGVRESSLAGAKQADEQKQDPSGAKTHVDCGLCGTTQSRALRQSTSIRSEPVPAGFCPSPMPFPARSSYSLRCAP